VTTFALVHGAWHGAWCWEKLVPELERRGHDAVAVDLPCDDVAADYPEYARVVAEALRGREDVVVVGHSLAGQTIPHVAALRPVARLVFLCSLVPAPEAKHPTFVEGFDFERDELGRSYIPELAQATAALYDDCDADEARWAFERLRPQARTHAFLPRSDWPDVAATYIVARGDRALSPDWQREAAAENGLPVVELDGGHSPFLARPGELADLLLTSEPRFGQMA
jgi:hypothetical protein